ncbi:MAG: hypothetical protein ABJG88_01100 [Litorimonas sp.]
MMKIVYISCCAALMLSACQNKIDDKDINLSDQTPKIDPNAVAKPAPIKVPLNGLITVSPEVLVSEDAACILPLRVSNGTDKTISVSMFDFKVTGSGQPDAGNMFARPTPSGEARTARVILIGQPCNAFNTVTIPEVLCVSEDSECSVDVGFEDSSEIKLINQTN